ncbi:MAG: hypothetical protein LBD84_05535 [Campylobacteraceae bacterium]|jgi:acetyl esterase/lipase|nr:hypothetical protein [Campylobacteraceae bacterium]
MKPIAIKRYFKAFTPNNKTKASKIQGYYFRGKPNAPFAIICPGGGFAYIGSSHEGFPLAKQISRLGFNAFVTQYRIGSEQYATEDLASAIAYIFIMQKHLKLVQTIILSGEDQPVLAWLAISL